MITQQHVGSEQQAMPAFPGQTFDVVYPAEKTYEELKADLNYHHTAATRLAAKIKELAGQDVQADGSLPRPNDLSTLDAPGLLKLDFLRKEYREAKAALSTMSDQLEASRLEIATRQRDREKGHQATQFAKSKNQEEITELQAEIARLAGIVALVNGSMRDLKSAHKQELARLNETIDMQAGKLKQLEEFKHDFGPAMTRKNKEVKTAENAQADAEKNAKDARNTQSQLQKENRTLEKKQQETDQLKEKAETTRDQALSNMTGLTIQNRQLRKEIEELRQKTGKLTTVSEALNVARVHGYVTELDKNALSLIIINHSRAIQTKIDESIEREKSDENADNRPAFTASHLSAGTAAELLNDFTKSVTGFELPSAPFTDGRVTVIPNDNGFDVIESGIVPSREMINSAITQAETANAPE